jgi:hypothetical protein
MPDSLPLKSETQQQMIRAFIADMADSPNMENVSNSARPAEGPNDITIEREIPAAQSNISRQITAQYKIRISNKHRNKPLLF